MSHDFSFSKLEKMMHFEKRFGGVRMGKHKQASKNCDPILQTRGDAYNMVSTAYRRPEVHVLQVTREGEEMQYPKSPSRLVQVGQNRPQLTPKHSVQCSVSLF